MQPWRDGVAALERTGCSLHHIRLQPWVRVRVRARVRARARVRVRVKARVRVRAQAATKHAKGDAPPQHLG